MKSIAATLAFFAALLSFGCTGAQKGPPAAQARVVELEGAEKAPDFPETIADMTCEVTLSIVSGRVYTVMTVKPAQPPEEIRKSHFLRIRLLIDVPVELGHGRFELSRGVSVDPKALGDRGWTCDCWITGSEFPTPRVFRAYTFGANDDQSFHARARVHYESTQQTESATRALTSATAMVGFWLDTPSWIVAPPVLRLSFEGGTDVSLRLFE